MQCFHYSLDKLLSVYIEATIYSISRGVSLTRRPEPKLLLQSIRLFENLVKTAEESVALINRLAHGSLGLSFSLRRSHSRKTTLHQDSVELAVLLSKNLGASLGHSNDSLHSIECLLSRVSVGLSQALCKPYKSLHFIKERLNLRDRFHKDLPATLLVKQVLRVSSNLTCFLLHI